MSILAELSGQRVAGVLSVLFFVAGPFLSLYIAIRAGVFRPASVVGPDRAGPPRSLPALLLVMLFGLTAWVLIPQTYVSAKYADGAGGRATTEPATTQVANDPAMPLSPTPTTRPGEKEAAISAKDTVIAASLAGVGGFVCLVVGQLLARPGGLRQLGLTLGGVRPAIPASLMGIALILPLLTWVNLVTVWLWETLGTRHPQKHDFLRILDESNETMLSVLLVLSATVIAPLYEELLFRGHFQTIFAALFDRGRAGGLHAGPPSEAARTPSRVARSRWAAIALASLMFALVHPWWTTPPIFFLSLCLGYAYERTGNLWVPIFIHALFNTTSVVLSRFVTA